LENANILKNELWNLLVADIKDDPENFPHTRPLLAHYTSMEVFEKIVKNEEVWFSNPLFMNDVQEIRFGVTEGSKIFKANKAIKDACATTPRYMLLVESFDRYFYEFSNKHAFDVYAFCLSKHYKDDVEDGRLSLWRGYGGNGKGVAIVFDLAKIDFLAGSPFVISRVHYNSMAESQEWLNRRMDDVAKFIQDKNIHDDMLDMIASILFERIKLAALFTKHHGFREEKEWRIVYLKERDYENKYMSTFGHIITNRGVEPKLQYKVKPIVGLTADDLSLAKVINQIILGPMASDLLARESVLRLLDNLEKSELKDKVTCSSIPYRHTN
jgi:hypothetical protein